MHCNRWEQTAKLAPLQKYGPLQCLSTYYETSERRDATALPFLACSLDISFLGRLKIMLIIPSPLPLSLSLFGRSTSCAALLMYYRGVCLKIDLFLSPLARFVSRGVPLLSSVRGP